MMTEWIIVKSNESKMNDYTFYMEKVFLNNSLIIFILNKLFFIINTINECIRHWLSMSNSNIKSWNINIYIYIYIVCSKVVKLKVGTNIDVLIHW